MNHIQTLETRDLAGSVRDGGCGECQTSCQSACKTSCGVANQQCEMCIRDRCVPKEQITVQVQPLAGRILLPKPAFERVAAQRSEQSAT